MFCNYKKKLYFLIIIPFAIANKTNKKTGNKYQNKKKKQEKKARI
jgi:hypothetical protein